MIHGTTINKVANIDRAFNRAARQVLLDLDPQETIRIAEFSNPIFNQVYDYAVPTDLKGNGVIDIRPQTPRYPYDYFPQQYNQAFDLGKNFSVNDSFTVQFNTGVKTIRINAPTLQPPITLNAVDSITTNGTWAVGSSASNLQVDNVNFISDSASLSFDLAAAGSTGYLENTTMQAVDLSAQENQSSLFLWTYFPTASDFTSVTLRWGSSSANYWSLVATVNQQGNAFVDGWNLVQYRWSSAAVTGTPDSSAVDYLRVTWAYNGTAQTAVRLDNIVSTLGTILEIEYYSKFMFRDATTGAFQENVTADTNLINLDTETYNVFLYALCVQVMQQLQGADAIKYDGPYFEKKYNEALARYKGMYKAQKQLPQSQYYAMPQTSPNVAIGIRWQ